MFLKWFLFSCISIYAGVTGQVKKKTAVVKKYDPSVVVEKKYRVLSTLEGKFLQEETFVMPAMTKKSQGSFFFKRPGKIRWETLQPSQSLLFVQNEKIIHYVYPLDPKEPGQLLEQVAKNEQFEVMQKLFSGNLKSLGQIEVQSEKSFLIKFQTQKNFQLDTVLVTINPHTSFMEELLLKYPSGNTCKVILKEIQTPKDILDTVFEFVLPSGHRPPEKINF